MPAYIFEEITSGQAAAFSVASDLLTFNAATPPVGAAVRVVLGAAGASVSVADRTVEFGPGVLGGAGLLLGDGSRLVLGTTSADSVAGTASHDQLLGGDGADTLEGLAGDDVLGGGAGGDVLRGGAGDDTLEGGADADVIDGGEGFDVLSFAGSSAARSVTLGGGPAAEGGDTVANVEGVQGSAFNDVLTGDGQANRLSGGVGDDTLSGEGGDDSLEGGRGDDVFDGGAGVDTILFSNPASGVLVNLELGRALSFDTLLGADTVRGVENVRGGSFGDALTGDGQSNHLAGLGGGDTLAGGGGADTLEGGDGGDRIAGDDGDDRIIGGAGADTLSGGLGADTFLAAAGDSPIDGFQTLVDRITDFAPGDLLSFVGGVPATEANYAEFFSLGIVEARARAQELFATEGKEYLAFQTGSQLLVLCVRTGVGMYLDNVGADAFSFANITTPVQVASTAPSAGPDSILGGAGPDTIAGGAGSDTINGGDGVSYLRGDEGEDSLLGGDAFDDINGNMGNDTVSTGAGDDFCVGGKDNDLLLGGAGADLVYGNLGNDTCEGGAGNDIVRGGQDDDLVSAGDGDDFISGDRGADTLFGGSGADIFSTFAETGIDRVMDFSVSEGDRVQLAPGTSYTVTQAGDDVIVAMAGGGQLILVGVSIALLNTGWIFGA